MPFVVAGLVLVGAVAVLNLLLTTAVIRRLRQLETKIAVPGADSGPPPGSHLPEFSVELTNGDSLAAGDLTGSPAILAFFSTGCPACQTAIPHLAEYAAVNNLKPRQVLAVVAGDDAEKRAELATALAGVAVVHYEDQPGPLATTFQVTALPTFVMVDDTGTVVRTVGASQPLVDRSARA